MESIIGGEQPPSPAMDSRGRLFSMFFKRSGFSQTLFLVALLNDMAPVPDQHLAFCKAET